MKKEIFYFFGGLDLFPERIITPLFQESKLSALLIANDCIKNWSSKIYWHEIYLWWEARTLQSSEKCYKDPNSIFPS